MASKTNTRRTKKLKARKCVASTLCSISPTGVVFLSGQPLEVSSEIILTIEASFMGVVSDWPVSGWVVECESTSGVQESHRVTLLFSEVPERLKKILALVEACQCPRVPFAELFGLN